MQKQSYTLKALADIVDAELVGDAGIEIEGLATLQNAGPQQLSFLANPAYAKYLASTAAGAVIVGKNNAEDYAGNKLIHDNPYLAYAKLSQLWSARTQCSHSEPQIHDAAIVSKEAEIGAGVIIGAGTVVEAGVRIADGVAIGPNCTLGKDCVLGEGSLLHAGVTLYHGVSLGKRCILHSGVVLGSDGFGFAPADDGWLKIEQLGGVIIEDDVEIGANTTVDRGALDNTIIRKGVILDNQIQVAHNVIIGENTAIAACSAIAGSTSIGRNCIVGGASGIAGHLTIGDGVHITAMTMVIKSLPEAGVYSSGTGVQPNEKWRKSIARLRQLDKMAARLKALEQRVKDA